MTSKKEEAFEDLKASLVIYSPRDTNYSSEINLKHFLKPINNIMNIISKKELIKNIYKNIFKIKPVNKQYLTIFNDGSKYYIRMSTFPKKTFINFDIINVKPVRRYRKGSKYDPILNAFLKNTKTLVEADIKATDVNFLKTTLNKRIEDRGLKNVKVSIENNFVYLEKV